MDLPELYSELRNNFLCFKFQHLGNNPYDCRYGAIHVNPKKTQFIQETESCSLEELAFALTEEQKLVEKKYFHTIPFPLHQSPHIIYPLTPNELGIVSGYVKIWYANWRCNFIKSVFGNCHSVT